MKNQLKVFLTLLIVIVALNANAQWQGPGVTGAGNMYFNNGNVGIGTTSPGSLLEIYGTPALDGSNPVSLKISSSRASSSWVSGADISGIDFYSQDGSGTGAGVKTAIRMFTKNAIASGYGLKFLVDNGTSFSEALRINSDGNVGIGTTSPDFKLHINSSENQLMRFTSTNGTWLDFESTNATLGSRIWSIGHVGTSNKFGVYQRDGTNQYRLLIDQNGNVGIGTTSPADLLHIHEGNIRIGGTGDYGLIGGSNTTSYGFGGSGTSLKMYSNSSTTIDIDHNSNSTSKYFALTSNGGSNTLFRVNEDGNIGIGTTSPQAELEISAGGASKLQLSRTGGHGALASIGQIDFFEGNYDNAVSARIEGTRGVGAAGRGEIVFSTLQSSGTSLQERMRIDYIGNVGIGTTDTFGYKLAVNGTIGTKEVNVEASSAWPDYVFSKDYKLKSLSDTESYIKEEGHLPNIPSAQEVAENGIQLGEMNAKLLEKIEELTLHLIEQNHRLESQQKRIEELEMRTGK